MGRSGKKKTTLEAALDDLLYDLCVEVGFCNRLSGAELLEGRFTVSAALFADTVLRAEGMNPAYEKKWRRFMVDRFKDRFGADQISKAAYRSETGKPEPQQR